MARRLLEHDRDTGMKTFHTYDHHSKETTIESVQDAAPYLEFNKGIQNMEPGGAMGLNGRSKRQIKKGWWHVASVPIGVQYHWLKVYGVDMHNQDHQVRVKKLLNDPDWAYLRTNPGRV
jgi:hypothetical protein